MTDTTPTPPNQAPAQAQPPSQAQPQAKSQAQAQAQANAPSWERATLEKLASSVLQEQRVARRWRNGIRIGWLLFFVMLVWLANTPSTTATHNATVHTAVVEIKGEIASGADASAEHVITAMRSAFEDKNAQAVVLLINSPGGSPVQAGMMNDEIVRLKAQYKKPVYAVVEETCASAAYYVAVAADKIYVDKASIVGSIGVRLDSFGYTGLMDKLGVERRLLTAGENKGILDPFSPQTAKQRAFAQTLLDQIHQQFIKVVKAGRGERLHETPDTFSGLFWTGEQGIAMGLVDQLGSLDYVAREVVKAEHIVNYTQKDSVADKLAKRFGASVGESMGESAAKSLKSALEVH